MSCKDCEPGSKRPTPHPGPRCVTHHRLVAKGRRLAAQERRVEQTYGLTGPEYRRLYAAQGGRCAICRRATGKVRRLSVDHDHQQAVLDGHAEDKGCRNCVRGLACGTCNKMLGHLRDDPEAFERAADYLRNWPARQIWADYQEENHHG